MKIRIISLKQDKILTDSCIDEPKGETFYSLYFFKSSGLIKTSLGLSDIKKGDCIILDSMFPIYIKCKQENIKYDNLSFKGADATRLVQQIGLELNTLHTPIHTFFIDSILDKISKELHANDLLCERIVAGCVDELLTKIYRFTKQDFVLSMPDHSQKLRVLRSEVHENFSKAWTIGQMAKNMELSPSRFASLYKKEFKISPTEDLIRTRIDQAKLMLSSTKVSVKKVALACGFESVHYFHRAFKKRNKITPKHFQNHMLSNKGSVPTAEKVFSLDSLSLDADFLGNIELSNGEIFLKGANQQWQEFLGYNSDILKTKPFFNLVSPTHIEVAKEAVNNIIEGKNVQNINIDLIKENGDLVSISFSAMIKGNAWFWFARQASLVN